MSDNTTVDLGEVRDIATGIALREAADFLWDEMRPTEHREAARFARDLLLAEADKHASPPARVRAAAPEGDGGNE